MSGESKNDFYFAYSASLRIMDVPDKHDEIANVLGVEPSICHKADEVIHVTRSVVLCSERARRR